MNWRPEDENDAEQLAGRPTHGAAIPVLDSPLIVGADREYAVGELMLFDWRRLDCFLQPAVVLREVSMEEFCAQHGVKPDVRDCYFYEVSTD